MIHIRMRPFLLSRVRVRGRKMDYRGVYSSAEIWPGFQMSNNFGDNADNESNAAATSYSVGLDPMLTDQRSNHSPSNQNSRKRSGGRAGASTSNSNGNSDSNAMIGDDNKRLKENLENEGEGEENRYMTGDSSKPAQPPKQDYIHVRARRGQATDSHSLAERARREKISERMKILQDLVPGCDKVIGKALVLDEIINYIQSLQRQVEFLSMKLEAVNTRMDINGFPQPKDQSFVHPPSMMYGSQSTREYGRGSSPEWLHVQRIGGVFKRPPS